MIERETIGEWYIEPWGIACRKGSVYRAKVFRGWDSKLWVDICDGDRSIHVPLAVIDRLREVERDRYEANAKFCKEREDLFREQEGSS